jgi:hypothetical protein
MDWRGGQRTIRHDGDHRHHLEHDVVRVVVVEDAGLADWIGRAGEYQRREQ